MLALGIDPGTAICGYGLVKLERSRLIPIHYGSILTDKDMLPEKRLQIIYEALTGLIKEYKPDFMSVEKLFITTMTTAIAVGQARGVIVLSAPWPICRFMNIHRSRSNRPLRARAGPIRNR